MARVSRKPAVREQGTCMIRKPERVYYAAVYARLSVEDNNRAGDRESITMQRYMLEKYVEAQTDMRLFMLQNSHRFIPTVVFKHRSGNDNLWFQQPNCKRRHIHVCNPDLHIIQRNLFHPGNQLPEAQPLSEYTDSSYKDARHINAVSPQAGHGSMRYPSCYYRHCLIFIKQLQLSKERDEQEG